MHGGVGRITRVSKVKAHQSDSARTNASPWEAHMARGNTAADSAAKAASGARPTQRVEDEWAWQAMCRNAQRLLTLAADTFPRWPKLGQRGGGGRRLLSASSPGKAATA